MDDLGLRINVTGGAAGAAEAQKVADSLKNVGVSAQQASAQASSAGAGIEALAKKLGIVAVATKAAHAAFSEMAENEQAVVALTRMGVAAEDMARAGALVENLKWVAGGEVEAASMLGRVLNGNTRELKRLGIEVQENATKEQLWAAASAAATRGLETKQAKLQTASGALEVFKDALGDSAGTLLQTGKFFTDLTEAVNELGLVFGFVEPIAEYRAKLEVAKATTEAMAAAAREQAAAMDEARSSIVQTAHEVGKLTQEYGDLAAAAERANKVSGSKRELEKKTKLAGIEKAIADGKMTPAEGARQKAQIEGDAAIEDAKANERLAQEKATDVAAQQRRLNEKADAMRDPASKLPPEERAKAFEQMDKLYDAAKAMQKDVDNARAEVEVAGNKTKSAEVDRKALDSTQTTEVKSEKKKEEEARQKRQEEFGKNAKTVREEADKQAAEEAKRKQPFRDFGGALRDAAAGASSPEERSRLTGLASSLSEGGTDGQIEEARDRGSRALRRRIGSSNKKRSAEAQEQLGRLESTAQAASQANDAPAAEASKGAAAAAEAAQAAVVKAMNDFTNALNGIASAANAAGAKANSAERTAGRGPGG